MVSNDPEEVGSATMKAKTEGKRANKPLPMSQGGGFVHFAQKSAGRSQAWATEICIIIQSPRIFIYKKFFCKPLDKSRNVCYNSLVSKEQTQQTERGNDL